MNKHILIAEDDANDFKVLQEAFSKCSSKPVLEWVKDGEELLRHLADHPNPGLILLDLNMPKKDGRQALKEIKADPKVSHIPIVILTTSNSYDDVMKAYQLGISTYIIKPMKFSELVESVKLLERYWFGLAQLPAK